MKFIRFLTIVAATSFLTVSGIELTKASTLHSGRKNASRALPSSSLNITKDSIFYSPTSDEVKAYYSTIKVGDKGDSFLTKLQTILKNGQKKVDYSSGDSASSSAWKGYYLYERDYSLSPLTATEVSTGKWKTSGIWVNSLYCKSPIYIADDAYINACEKTDSKTGDVTFEAKTYQYYTDWNVETHSGTQLSSGTWVGSSAQFDREHVFPKSFGFNGASELYKKLTAGCDAHNLHAGEHVGNSTAHGNLPYGNVANKSATTTAKYTSGITGECVGYVGNDKNGCKVYEPNDEDKGDIARTCFYMIARYHNYEVDPANSSYHTPALTLADKVTAGSTHEPEDTESSPIAYGELSDLLEWNEQDPVDDEEIRRNDLVYLGIQGNRNPFVDFPSWAKAAFNKSTVTFDDISIRKAYLGETSGGGSSSSSSSSSSLSSSSSDKTSSSNESSSSSQSSSSSENISQEAGAFEGGETTTVSTDYDKVFSTDNLIPGSKVVIACKNVDYAVGGALKTYYRQAESITKSGSNIAISDNVEEFTLVNGLEDGSYAFQLSDGNYLTSDSKYNNLTTKDTVDGYSSFNITFDDSGTASITAVSGSNNIMAYYSTYTEFSCHSSSKTGYDDELLLYTVQPTDDFSSANPTASLSFRFDIETNGNTTTYSNFGNVSMFLRSTYDFSSRSDYTEAGMILIKNGVSSDFEGSHSVSKQLPEKGSKIKWKDYQSTSLTIKVSSIPDTAYNNNICVVGYILVNGVYYYSQARSFSVISLLNLYTQSNANIICNKDDGSKTLIKVSELANSFLNEIGD